MPNFFILYFHREAYLCNLLTEMFRPRFENPIDSVQDAVDRNITVFEHQYNYHGLKADLMALNITEWTSLAERMVPLSYDEYDYYIEHYIHGNRTETSGGTHAFMQSHLFPPDLAIAPADKWWRSFDKLPGKNPYAGYLTDKKWILNEVDSPGIHFSKFTDAGTSITSFEISTGRIVTKYYI